ncbi:MAG: NAD(P)/FAD-dependent oxidoreductase [Bariatricus sp.]
MGKQIVVAGGGAAGMMAALSAAKEGANVTIIEHNDRVGRKILSTGNGRCNYTNLVQSPQCYRSDGADFPWKIISRYPAEWVIRQFEEMGVMPKDKNGYIYPFSEQASAVQDVLRMELERCKVKVVTSAHVSDIMRTKKGWQVEVIHDGKKKEKINCDAVILACGSKAASKLGNDGSGYDLAKKLGHKIIPVVPALVQLKCREKFYSSLAGVRVNGKVSILIDGKKQGEDTGEIQLTAYGISGIPVFQISRIAAKGLYRKQAVFAELDFMPQMTEDIWLAMLKKRKSLHPEKEMSVFFTGVFHKKLAEILLKRAEIPRTKKAGKLTEEELTNLVREGKHFRTEVTDTNPFEQAQICAGGVATAELSDLTLESRIAKGIFFAGELVDVDGICGGYNLHWAWASGYLAGKGAANA